MIWRAISISVYIMLGVSYIWVKPAMTKTLCFGCLLFLYTSATFAQTGKSDRCEVTVADVKAKKTARFPTKARSSTMRWMLIYRRPIRVLLGRFTTVIAEEELTTRAFRLPRTNLYIVASVFHTDSDSGSLETRVSLELALSSKRKRDVLHSLSWAEAEMPLNGFDVGRVTMLVKAGDRPQLVRMECKKDVRR